MVTAKNYLQNREDQESEVTQNESGNQCNLDFSADLVRSQSATIFRCIVRQGGGP